MSCPEAPPFLGYYDNSMMYIVRRSTILHVDSGAFKRLSIL